MDQDFRSWTVVKLKDKLRELNLPVSGKKAELITRLELKLNDDGNNQIEATTKSKPSPALQIGDKKSRSSSYNSWSVDELQGELKLRKLSISGNKVALIQRILSNDKQQQQTLNNSSSSGSSSLKEVGSKVINIWNSPFVICWYFGVFVWRQIYMGLAWLTKRKFILLIISLVSSTLTILHFLEGSHSPYLDYLEDIAAWYSYWVFLGVLSSIGLGSGAHTFLLFLGPLIARVATTAYKCSYLKFAIRGPNSFKCPPILSGEQVNVWGILDKVKFESFLWGAGTALGELPPYFIARASALSGKSNEELDHLQELKDTPSDELSFAEWIQLKMYNLMEYFGFWGILLCASIPNPLFDLAGITCGYFGVPFATFFSATLIGKSIFKVFIQSFAVAFMFSAANVESIIYYCKNIFPEAGEIVESWILRQQDALTGQSKSINENESLGTNYASTVWNIFLFFMMGYFMLTTVDSVAKLELRKEEDAKRSKIKRE